jgi:peptidoglycan/LPS O-acetylase OafA/YrhL
MVISHATAVASIVTFGNDWNDDTSLWTYMYLYILVAASSLIFGYVLSLLVERPFMNLAKAVPQFYKLFGPAKKDEQVQV